MQRRSTPGLVAVAAAVACLLAPAAQAEGEDELLYAQRGFYLGGGGNFMLMTRKGDINEEVEKSLGMNPAFSSDTDDSFGMNFRAGYRLNPKLAIESQFEWLSNAETTTRLNGLTYRQKLALMMLTGNVKYFLLTGRVQPYLLVGAGWGHSQVHPANGGSLERGDGWGARLGGGAALYGSRDVAFNLEVTYVHPMSGKIEDLDHVSFGAGITLFFYPK